MSAEDVQVLKRFNDELAERGAVPWDLIDPQIVVVDHDIPDAGDYRGHEGFRKWLLEDWASAWESYTVEVPQLLDAGDTVVSVFTLTARGKGSGISVTRRNATVNTVNTVKNGRLTRVEYYTTEQEALTAAGLAAARES